MQIIENIIEKYDWAINLYIIGSFVAYAVSAIVILIVAYNIVKIIKKDKINSAKWHKDFEQRVAETRKRMEERRNEFFKK